MTTKRKDSSSEVEFLNLCIQQNNITSIFLSSGLQLKGYIVCCSSNVIFLKDDGDNIQMIYKHAIASILPRKEINGNA